MARIFTLKLPPTSNHRLMPITRGESMRLIKSPEYRRWMRESVADIMRQNSAYGEPIFTDRVGVSIFVAFPDKRRRDLDNLIKPINDVLTQAAVIADDSLIDFVAITRAPAWQGRTDAPALEIYVGDLWEFLGEDVRYLEKKASKQLRGDAIGT